MSLVHLPHAIWHDLLFSWLGGGLPVIARVDCACAIQKLIARSLLPVYGGKSFPFSDGFYVQGDVVLAGLCRWLRSREVYISHLRCVQAAVFPLPLWEDLFSWCADTIESLNVQCGTIHCADIVSVASKTLKRLQRLTISGEKSPRPAAISQLLQNNADTLISIIFHGFGAKPIMGLMDISAFSRLRVLQCPHSRESTVCDFLRLCPKLIALNLRCDGSTCNTLLTTIAESCPLLQRLKLTSAGGVSDELMLQVAQGCPRIEYLCLSDCYFRTTARFAEVVNALPYLHTLGSYELPGTVWSDLAPRGTRKLRALKVVCGLTYSSLRRQTAALPQLTALSVLAILGKPDCTNIFEYCGNLEHLQLHGCNKETELVARTALLSIAMYCPNLQTLVLGPYVPYNRDNLIPVLESCPKLSRLQIISDCVSHAEVYDSRVVFGNSFADVFDWMPAEVTE